MDLNLRRLFSILAQIKPEAQAAAISLDAEKSFDSVSWLFAAWATISKRLHIDTPYDSQAPLWNFPGIKPTYDIAIQKNWIPEYDLTMKTMFPNVVPETQQSLVSALLNEMEHSIGASTTPNPSVLIASNLAGSLDINAQSLLVQQLKQDAVERVTNELSFTSGQVALYVLGFRSSCEDPSRISSVGKSVNLLQVLESKVKQELANIKENHTPLTTYYQVALDVLALCIEGSAGAYPAGEALAQAAKDSQLGLPFSVDTGAMAAMALTCLSDAKAFSEDTKSARLLKDSLALILKRILEQQQSDGTIGNIYSTGLAAQALSAAWQFYPSELWSCTKTLSKVLSEIPKGKFSIPTAASQVLPFLKGKTYLDVGSSCAPENVPSITVDYTIVNDLLGESFKFSIQVSVPEGSVLLDVMKKAQQMNSKEFSFKTEDTSQGLFVSSIHGLVGSTNERTYWQFFSGMKPLMEGVATYRPTNKEHILAIYSKY
ncbi:cobalamin binding intrinsic factor-like [Ambystoma mexicanum]|uniref:cobalamin binding intrinsic factor-like n=1 Tax=Ambystoma mexicanum TaxID=8296 RepID=UPI0037E755E4